MGNFSFASPRNPPRRVLFGDADLKAQSRKFYYKRRAKRKLTPPSRKCLLCGIGGLTQSPLFRFLPDCVLRVHDRRGQVRGRAQATQGAGVCRVLLSSRAQMAPPGVEHQRTRKYHVSARENEETLTRDVSREKGPAKVAAQCIRPVFHLRSLEAPLREHDDAAFHLRLD